MRSPVAAGAGTAILLILGLGQATRCLFAEPLPEKLPAGALAGVVVDPTGAPAPGVTVSLVGRAGVEEPKAVETTSTDAQGRFVFPEAKSKYGRRDAQVLVPGLFARDAEGRIGWERYPWTWPWGTPRQNLKVELIDAGDAHGRLVDAGGREIAGAAVRPTRFYAGSRDDSSRRDITLAAELADQLACQTDAQGRFTVRGVPAEGGLLATITAEGFGSPRVTWDLPGPVALRLDRVGGIRGSLTGPADAPLGDVKLHLYYRTEQSEDAKFHVFYSAETSTAADGAFEFQDVPPGTYQIQPALYDDNRPFFAEAAPVDVRAGETTADVLLPVTPAIEIRGRVVDAANGQGIAEVGVSVSMISEQGYRKLLRRTITDAEGRYVAYAEPGKIAVRASEAPADYVPPSQERDLPKMDVTAALDWPVIELERAVQLDLLVVDPAGQPVPGAEVHALLPRNHRESLQEQTDANGRFTIRGLAPNDALSVRARTDRAVSDTQDLRPADADGPVRLVVSPEQAFTLRGVCLDGEGRPVPGARVSTSTVWMLGPSGLGFSVSGENTDAEGRFELAALWPGFHYEINVTADGYRKFESARIEGRPGQVHDVGTLNLIALGGAVEGQVVDSAGEPVADVRVFNTSDAAEPVSVRTDASGRFRLEGFPAGPVYVFAEKQGYRFGWAWTESSAAPLTIRLPKSGEPIPAWKPKRAPASFAEQQAVARRLLETLWAEPAHRKTNSIFWTLRLMARIDPEKALEWSAQVGGRYGGYTRQTVAEKVAEADADEALALLSQSQDLGSFSAILSLAERFAESDPDKAVRFAEEAVVRARSLDQPDRTSGLAQAGGLVVRLGQAEAGRKLVEQAADMAAKLGTDDRSGHVRAVVAAALAPHDLGRAMALVEPIGDDYARGRGLAKMAAALAPHDLDKALQIVDGVSKRSTLADLARLKIAYQLAPTRPDDAMRAVEAMDTHGALKIQAEAYGWLAVAVAPHDKARAWALVDRSMAIYRDHAFEFRSWSNFGGRAPMAAHVVAQAGQIGHPDMEELIGRVLAMRPTAAEWYSPREVAKASVLTAKILALVDPESARQLLETIQPQAGELETADFKGVEPDDWFHAWALADLNEAEKLFQQALQAAREKKEFDLPGSGWVAMLEALTTPPPARAQVMLRRNGGFWFPDTEL